MIRLPDLRPIFVLAVFGLACAAIILISVAGWLGYHLVRAVALYLGGA